MLLSGKRGFVVGVSNARSIGWAVAKSWAEHGAELIIGVESSRFVDKVRKLVETELSESRVQVVECNLDDDKSLEALGPEIQHLWPEESLDMACHAVAFAPKTALHNRFVKLSREDFARTMQTSVYSFIGLARTLEPLMARPNNQPSASLMTLTFDGSQRAVPGYGIMGPAKGALESTCKYLAADLGVQSNIRVNAISAGPLNTLAARGLPRFHDLKDRASSRQTLPQDLTSDDVGQLAAFLASDMAARISGQTLFVDGGASSQAFSNDPENP